MLMGAPAQSGLAIVQAHWREQNPSVSWPESVRAGVIAGDGHPVDVSSSANGMDGWSPQPLPFGALEVVFRPDATVWDGRYANNGWLQELPKPHTQLTWGNAALISTQLAGEQDLANGDVIVLEHEGRSIEAPVWITPGQAARSITLHLGYGRTHAGRVGNNLGFNAYRLRTTHQPWIARGVSLRKAGRSVQLVSTQQHFDMESPEPVRSVTLADLSPSPSGRGVGVRVRSERDVNDSQGIDHPASPVPAPPAPLTLYPDQPQGDYAWGMTVDLNTCIGCKGCAIAWQAENGISVGGADQVLREREMHWIRVDRYYSGPAENPVVHHQPVPCMQCEHAPCEVVCPVGATVHDDEGLNLQVYNRCIGTRFCSNNCPYKVRRFNFLQFNDVTTETLKAQRNPQVTVRNRGVMEKCTYCIQRIENAHIAADREQREIKDGEVVTACQAACPTQAITFGNLRDPNSAVSRLKKSPRNYDLLEELNTRPRTSYLAHVRNRHPDLENDT
jgi:Fe-S-cluster-containing dehydrogenase component